MEFMIEAKELTFEYPVYDENGSETGTVRAVDQMNILVQKGEFVAVLGHNGSGKSTFARHINALFLPTSGTITVDGMDTRDDTKIWDIRKDAGMVFQNPDNQIIASVVEEDVAFGPENLGFAPAKIRENVDASLKSVHMEAYREASPNKLSGGQKQRVAVAGILAMEPECIILDEPTAMLDPSGRREVMETIEYLNREKKMTIIYITHHMEEAARADRIVVMDHGHVVMSGKPRQVFTQVDRMKELGLDVPQATELAWRLRKRGIMVPQDIMTMEEMTEALCRLK
ncbi:MAG TPA: energy-coupling factor transporter ATPase [Candidatus Faecimorpha stercoravium]|nr:energy-coupling factor transporter ATPase [Candidatus Faecimorpha stercoravium]